MPSQRVKFLNLHFNTHAANLPHICLINGQKQGKGGIIKGQQLIIMGKPLILTANSPKISGP